MLQEQCLERAGVSSGGARTEWSGGRPPAKAELARVLKANETLFGKGEARGALYRVERGALCHYIRWDDGRHDIIEFAFPGDIIGFGHLDHHISTAQAVVDTEVSLVAASEFAEALEADGQLSARAAAADDREFEYVRAKCVEAGRGRPVRRVASLLAALSQISVPEGRDPALITDEIASEAVADQLDMSATSVAEALGELESRGLIESSVSGLRIVDRAALERLADAA